MKEISEEEMLKKLMAVCAKAEHCTADMRRRMQKMQIEQDAQERIIEYLIKHRFIDEERYARIFINEKIKFNKWGRRKVEQALWEKRVEKDIYMPILDEIEDETYIERLKPLIETKKKNIKAASVYERNTKLIRFALGRGFEINIIRQCIEDEGDIIEDVDE